MRRLISLILLVTLLAACSGSGNQPGVPSPVPTGVAPNPTPAGSDQVTITFAAWDYERAIYEPLTEKFTAENPNINVVLVPLDDLMSPIDAGPGGAPESATSALRRIVSGADTAPSFSIVPEAIGTPLLLDLKPLMDADATFKRDDFYPGALERWSTDGGTWMLPRYFYIQTLNYNKDLFQLANLPAPEAGWTWDDLLAAAEQIKLAGGRDTYGFLDTSGGTLPLVAVLEKEGVNLLEQGADARVDTPEIAQALERVQQLYKDGVLLNPYGGMTKGSEQGIDPAQIVREGRAAIWGELYFGGPDGQPEELPFETGHIPYPVSPATNVFMGSGAEGYLVSGGTAYPNESWKWIEFLSRQQIEQPGQGRPIYNAPGRVPARQSLADATGFWDSVDEETAAALRWTLENGPPPVQRSFDYLPFGALSQALNQVLTDPKTDIDKALADAQAWLEENRNQTQLTPTPEPDTSPVLVATPEVQEIPAGATRISFLTYGYSPTELRRLVRKFREEQSDVYVELKSTDTFTGPVQIADLARLGDCFAWTQSPQTEEDYKALLDLQPFFDADATFPRDDYPPALLSAYEYNGGVYGLPHSFNVRNLSYNRTQFDATGLTAPTGDWTPADFLAAAQALTTGEGEQKQYGYVPLGGPQSDLMFFVSRFGGRLTTGSGQDLRPNFTDPQTIEAIRWFLDLDQVHKVMPPITFYYKRDSPGYEDRSYELIQGGKAGMWFDYGYGMFAQPVKDFSAGQMSEPAFQERNFEVGVAPLPVGDGGLSKGDFFVRGYHISAGTQNAQACWTWLKFLSTDTSLIYGDLPARISVAESDAFTSSAGPERVEIYKLYADVLKKPVQGGEDINALYTMDSYWFFKALSATLEENADLATELEAAQKTTTTFQECVAGGGKPWDCALEADPEYQGYNVEPPEGGFPMGWAP